MDLLRIAARVAGDVVPIERHKGFRTREQREKELGDRGLATPDEPGFRFERGDPDPELLEHYERNGIEPDPAEVEAILNIKQLADALAKGSIGFEWFSAHVEREMKKAGW